MPYLYGRGPIKLPYGIGHRSALPPNPMLGPALELIEIGAVATSDYLLKELPVIERVDGMIVRLLKQLLLIRGVKSVSSSASTGSSIGELAKPPWLTERRSSTDD